MQYIRVAAATLNQTPLDWDRNLENIFTAIDRARDQRIGILCLPELCITGYGCEDEFHNHGVQRASLVILKEIAERSRGLITSVGLPLAYAGGVFDAACLICDGEIMGFVGKQHLAGDGIHYEPRWFKRWPEGVRTHITLDGTEYPLGDLLFSCGGVRIGFEICEDAWVGDRPGSNLAQRGADIILNPSASHFALGKHAIRRRFVLEGSRAFQVVYVYANLVGNEAGRAIYDGDAMIASRGEMLATGRRFSFQRVTLTSCAVDIDVNRITRARTSSFEPEIDGDETNVVTTEFAFEELGPEDIRAEQTCLVPESWEGHPDIRFEEFSRAVSLGLFDYLTKSRSQGVVVSLSGGVDSAAVAVLARMMLTFAYQQLTMEQFDDRFEPTGIKPSDVSQEELVKAVVITVYQATQNSSETTRQAAHQLAEALGSRHFDLNVDPLVGEYVKLVSESLGRELNWDDDDIALQNIQARVRSPGVWMISNLFNALLLSTCNRSEAAVGYTTMDGDTSGGLAPIAGIDKAFLRRWLRWMETDGPRGLPPIPALKSINDQVPTAELRPPGERQTDEDDLMPYEALDQIERLAIRDKQSPRDIFRHYIAKHPESDPQEVGRWIDRFFRLFCRNQWKRERYAPSFHLDDENLDPKTWCRYPILSGGSVRELEKMWAYIEANAVS